MTNFLPPGSAVLTLVEAAFVLSTLCWPTSATETISAMTISRFSSKKTAFPPHAILLCAWMICVLSKTGVFQTHAFSTSHRASAPCADQATVGHISSLSYLRSSPYSADSGSSPLYRRIDGAGGAGARKRRGRTATSMSQNESRNVFHEGPMRRYLRMFRSRLLPGSTNSELNSRSATPIERLGMVRGRILSGQEAERSIATTLGAVAGQDTTEGSSTVDPTPVGTAVKGRKFSVQGLLGGLKKLRSAVDVPEAATDEGRFLLMAAFVGVLTGTSGKVKCGCGDSTEKGWHVTIVNQPSAGPYSRVQQYIWKSRSDVSASSFCSPQPAS